MTTPSNHSQPRGRALKKVLAAAGILLLGAVALFLLLGLVPGPSAGLDADPAPAAAYTEAIERYQPIELAEQGVASRAGSSRLMTHGAKTPRAYVMIHGITNSPLQWAELGQALYDKGHNILILRMPYHGLVNGEIKDLKDLKGQDLRAYADQAVDIAAGLGDEVVVVGISGGGAVAAWMAQNRPEVDRALLLAPFFGIKGVPGFANTLLKNAFSRLPNLDFDNPSEPRREWVYRGEASRGVAAFLTLGLRVMDEASSGAVPAAETIVITTAVDNTASNASTTAVVGQWEEAGAKVTTFEFGPEMDIPHNSVDPSADPVKKQVVYETILNLLGE